MKNFRKVIWYGLLLLTLVLLSLGFSSCGDSRQVVSEASEGPIALPATSPAATMPPFPTTTPIQTVTPASAIFDGDAAFRFLEEQMEFGPRWPGSPGHQAVGDYIVGQVRDLGWQVEEQRFAYRDIEGRNIIGRANEGAGPVIILGAHYDTRKIADQTPGSNEPVPGAVDGASGVAILLELARTLDIDDIEQEIWLAFFDVEDNGSGGIPGFDWIVGSTYMADHLEILPEAMILVDMVGDADQQLYYEGTRI